MRPLFFYSGCIALLLCAFPLQAQELHQDVEEVIKGEVIEIVRESSRSVVGTETQVRIQDIRVRLLSGSQEGSIIEFENDRMVLKEGQKIYINHLVFVDGTELYQVRDVDRTKGIYILLGLFAGVVLLFGGTQGARSLLSLAGSFLLIVFVLFPLFLAGYSPLLVSIVVGPLILCLAVFATHGISVRSAVATLGATLAILCTAWIAVFGIDILALTGFFSEETIYLNMSTVGTLDFQGLLLGSIIIGVLGVLDDIAVTQVAVVSELKETNPHISRRELYLRALRVGKEHVSALVNTIVLAYAGVSLPLLLLFSQSASPFMDILNNEIFATEILRTIAGSIGLIATVPITTLLAVYLVSTFKQGHGGSHHGHAHAHHLS